MSLAAKEAFEKMEDERKRMIARAQNEYDASLIDDTYPGRQAHSLAYDVEQAKLMVEQAALVPGLEDYIRATLGNPTYDLASQLAAFVTDSDALTGWVYSVLPSGRQADTNALVDTDRQGRDVEITYTIAQTAPYRTNIQAYIDGMNGL